MGQHQPESEVSRKAVMQLLEPIQSLVAKSSGKQPFGKPQSAFMISSNLMSWTEIGACSQQRLSAETEATCSMVGEQQVCSAEAPHIPAITPQGGSRSRTEAYNPGKAAISDWQPYLRTLCGGLCIMKREAREALSINAPVDVLQVTPL